MQAHLMNGKGTLILLLSAGLLLLGILFRTIGYRETFTLAGVRASSSLFYDAATITGGAESYRFGFDPLYANPFDPSRRPLNYPRTWHVLFHLGLKQTHTFYLGATFIALFLIGVLLFSPKVTTITAVVVTAVVFSPAVLLAMERANSDLLVFFLLAAALWFQKRSSFASLAWILSAFALKLYPVFGLFALVGESAEKRPRLLLVAALFILCFVGAIFEDLPQISAATQKTSTMAYGIHCLPQFLEYKTGIAPLSDAAQAVAYLVVVFALVRSLRRRDHFVTEHLLETSGYIDSFRMGGAVYVGTFLYGNNFDYRLLFTIFTLPQLIQWIGDRNKSIASVAKGVIFAVLYSVWSIVFYDLSKNTVPFGNYITLIFDEIVNWTVFVGLLFLLIQTVPPRWFSFGFKNTMDNTPKEGKII